VASTRPFYLRWSERLVSSRLGASFFRKTMHHIDVPLMKLTKGRVSFASAYPVMLLTTTGAKSGKQRTVPVLYIERDDGGMAIIGTRFGSQQHPGWVHNLRKHPTATVEIKGERQTCAAREAAEDERGPIWATANEMYSGYDRYAARANRKIPILILTPAT